MNFCIGYVDLPRKKSNGHVLNVDRLTPFRRIIAFLKRLEEMIPSRTFDCCAVHAISVRRLSFMVSTRWRGIFSDDAGRPATLRLTFGDQSFESANQLIDLIDGVEAAEAETN